VNKQLNQKQAGAYYTPDAVVQTLSQWAVRNESDRLIDPACGDGRFIAGHRNAVGIEQDGRAAGDAIARAPWALVHEGDFFSWAAETTERFECAVGNPPFIRYQHFTGQVRARALELCGRLGANFSGLTSSWAPFIAATVGLLKPGGRLAFVVPAEIGHAPYAAPLLDFLVERFALVHVMAVRAKLFPELSEDCWLLYAEGHGGSTDHIRFTAVERFAPSAHPPRGFVRVGIAEWRHAWNRRLRPFLLRFDVRDLYRQVAGREDTRRLGDFANVGIGYVSGANEFFHLRPSEALRLDIPWSFLHTSVRNGRALTSSRLTQGLVDRWKRDDEPVLLLKISKDAELPQSVRRYLETDAGQAARTAYKCRVRDPWYAVPDVRVPDFFLTYMAGLEPSLVRNDAQCTCTNSVHAVRIKAGDGVAKYFPAWKSPFVQLSCEIEGHPLGGGLLKLEPREATQVMLPAPTTLKRVNPALIEEAVGTMRQWRHYAS
jgi:adenine-specific DNA-methyltransferase